MLNYTLEGNVAVVTMDDGKANALSVAMIDGLLEALAKAEAEAGAMILTGRPEKFCAGFDLRVMMSGPDNAKALLARGSELLMKLYGAGLPLVIACTGHALAGGALVVLTGDYRIGATGDFRIGLNEVSIGLPVPLLAMELARDRLLPTALHHATLNAQIYSPDDARSAGYLDAVVAPADLLTRAKVEATRLAALPKSAYKATKKRLRGRTIDFVNRSLTDDMNDLLIPTRS